MQTDTKYLGDEIFVTMAGGRGPDWYVEHMEARESTVMIHPAKDRHAFDPEIPVDGWVTFYDPDLLDAGEAFMHGTFPFRSVREDGPWFARPESRRGQRNPIWKWQNPEADPHEGLTLKPSIGKGDPMNFHCFVRDGEIEWR